MTLKTVRYCDRTGEPGADATTFAVGSKVWTIDLTEAAVKELEDVLDPWIAVAQPVDDVSRAAGTVVDDVGGLTGAERGACRLWAQQNEKRLNLPATGDQGRLRQAVVDAWTAAGRPAARRSGKAARARKAAGP